MFSSAKQRMVGASTALADRPDPIRITQPHAVLGVALHAPYPDDCEIVDLGLGCFWGAERLFWQLSGVYVTAVGYAGGFTANPSYRDVCSGSTGHAEIVRVVFQPQRASPERILQLFWEAHDPTQGMRQGNDVGTQYRSAIYCHSEAQLAAAQSSRDAYQEALAASGVSATITTELAVAGPFYFAEEEHQQYLAKHPGGYCGLRGTGVACPIPDRVQTAQDMA